MVLMVGILLSEDRSGWVEAMTAEKKLGVGLEIQPSCGVYTLDFQAHPEVVQPWATRGTRKHMLGDAPLVAEMRETQVHTRFCLWWQGNLLFIAIFLDIS